MCVCVRNGRKNDGGKYTSGQRVERKEQQVKIGKPTWIHTSVGEVAVAFSLNTVGGHQGCVCGSGSLTCAAETSRLHTGGGRAFRMLRRCAPGSVRRRASDRCSIRRGSGAGGRGHKRRGAGGGRAGGRTVGRTGGCSGSGGG